MSRARLAVLILFLAGLVAATVGGLPPLSAAGGPRLAPHVPGEILISFKPGAPGLERASAMAALNASRVQSFRSGGEHWRLGPGMTVEKALERMSRNPHVRYAEPNFILTTDLIPNDPNLPQLYGMINTGQTGGTADADIDADQAWSIARGSRNVIVGIIDTGIDYNHPDLTANIWTNPGETAGNGVDDDGNGFIDDIHGWDFVNNDNDPMDDNGHGTHCAGTIGAVGNNGVGVVGVNWEVSLMGLKFLSASGSGSTAGAISAVNYTVTMKQAGHNIALTSNSWGGGGFSQALSDAIAAAGALDMAFIAAAGNNGTNNDTSPHYPSNYTLPSIISVAATDHNDAPASFTNYGAVSVDIAAPGVNIYSTQPGNRYQNLSGTSMATPHVAGAAALLKSRFPNLPVAQLKFALMSFADQKAVLHPTTGTRPVASGGRLNVFFSIADPDDVAPGAVGDLEVDSTGSNHAVLSWTATGDDGATGTAASYQMRYSTEPIDETNIGSAARAGNEPNPGPSGSAQTMEVGGLEAGRPYYFAVVAYDEWGNAGPISNLATGETLPPPTVAWTPTSIAEELLTGQMASHTVTLRNDGVGTLDFEIPSPLLSEPFAAPVEPLLLEKGQPDPRVGEPVIEGAGGPDGFGYRWTDSNEPGGPAFSWQDISGTGTLVADVTTDDDTSAAIPLGFTFPFYGNGFTSIRVCSNGWLSFTSADTEYSNQSLPSSGAPTDLVAPFWDDLDPGGVARIYFQSFGNRAIVQWHNVPRYNETGSSLRFQAILESSGIITYQYDNLVGTLNSATVGIQNGTRSIGLTTAFNTSYVANGMAVRYASIPQWLHVSPTSGRIPAGGSVPLQVDIDAAGLEGGHYPGQIRINNNDPNTPVAAVDVLLHVIGAPDAAVNPASLDFGDRFVGVQHNLSFQVVNNGTDTLVVSDIASSHPEVVVLPAEFNVAPHGARTVNVQWTPSAVGPLAATISVMSNDAGDPVLEVPVAGNSIAVPVVVVNPTSFEDTLFSGNTSTHLLNISNTGGSNLIVNASADQGAAGAGITSTDPSIEGQGGPDAFGYRWRDSDAPGGPAFNFIDISSTGTTITFSSQDDALSAVIPMGMNFPLYGTAFSSLKVSTNGWLTFDTTTTASANSNGTLPSTSLGRSAIAMYWDDLHIRTGNIKYLNDGTRFIVQYTNVGRFSPSTGHSFTFQVQLYPNGRIMVMYQTMSGTTLNSATVGIQNQARTTALQVVSQTGTGTPYAHNNMALQISRTPDWLSVSPASVTVPPGESRDVNVMFDATERTGGTLTGTVRLATNVPGQETLLLPAVLNVIGAPNVRALPASFNFGTAFAGYPQLTSFQVINEGTDVLNVSDVSATDPSLSVEALPGPTAGFSLAPGASRVLNLRWLPPSPGPLSASVIVTSDDPDSASLALPVLGNAIAAPVAGHSPSSFSEAGNSGDVFLRTLRLENTGGSDLTYNVALRALGGEAVPIHDELKLDKEEADPRPGILGSGGPDLFGYSWKDSDDAGGPTFAWTDISGIGTPIAGLDGDDEVALNIPIGFAFPYYNGSFSTVNVNTNGWVSFTSTLASGSAAYTNQPLPNSGTSVPENLLAVFWDDLHFRSAVRAHYHNDGTRFIVQYTNVDRITTGSSLTFQVILYPNGRIVYQYLTMSSPALNSSTIGQQNATRNDGLTVVHNAAYMHDNLAIEFRPPVDFLSVDPVSGTIPPGGFADLEVRLDLAGLLGGDYLAAIDILTNDPASGIISVPVSLHVEGIQDVEVTPASLSFPTTFVGFGSSLPIVVSNAGTDILTVTSIQASGAFSVNAPALPVALPVNGTIPLTVTFTPTAAGAHVGELTVLSDDPDEPSLTAPLSGNGLIPPEIDVAPGSISTALPPGGTRTKTLTVYNNGGSELVWDAGTSIVSALREPVTVHSYLELDREEIDPRPGILGSGGPDMFGYTWKDSDDPSGPTFDWVDINGVGTRITFNDADGYCVDCTSGPLPIGFQFPFYGNAFSTMNVTTEGWISFTNTSTAFSNQPLPNSGSAVPENLLAAFWDDLVLRNGSGSEDDPSSAWYHYDGNRLIVQWDNFYRIADYDDDLNFQIILYPSGKIVYQYQTMSSQTLTSATIGQQNAAKNDGLTVIHNVAYMHDNLAIQIQAGPEWITVSPESGVIPAGGSQDVTVVLNAAGLEDGLHEAEIGFNSNDPYTPLVEVPVSLNVGTIEPAYLHFDPEVLNLSANGHMVKMVIELPVGYDPHLLSVASVTLNDTVPALPSPVEFTDENENGIEEIVVRFDRDAVDAILPEGAAVPLTLMGEITDVQWFRGTTTARTMRPRVSEPNGGEYFLGGQVIPITWASVPGAKYKVLLTRDGGQTWEPLADNLTDAAFSWTSGGSPTSNARVRVIAYDNQGVMGYDTSDAVFSLAGPLMPPSDVGDSLEVDVEGQDLVLTWRQPVTDAAHGPVESFRVLRSLTADGPFVEIGRSTGEMFRDPLAATTSTFVYYKVIATNAAGDATE